MPKLHAGPKPMGKAACSENNPWPTRPQIHPEAGSREAA